MDITYNPDRKYLECLAADILAAHTKKLLEEKDEAVWALPGGRSVGGIFDILSENADLDWSRIHFFMADERLVPVDETESNFRLLMERLLYPLLKRGKTFKKNMHPFIYRKNDKDSGLRIYKRELIKFGGKYDAVLLSSGEDGHIAGLYPDHSSIRDNAKYFIKMDNSPKPPPERMTSSRNLLASSLMAVLLFFGKGKKDALNMFRDSKLAIEKCPAKIVSLIEKSYVLTDQD